MTPFDQLTPYLELGTEGLVGFGQFAVGPVEGLDLDLVFADFGLVLLLEASDLGLVAGLDLNDGTLELIQSTLTGFAVERTYRKLKEV